MGNNNNEIKDFELLQTFIRQGDASSLKEQLLRSNSGVECKDEYDNTPLLQAAFLGQFECVKLLLELGQANFEVIDVFGQNALTLATYAGCLDCIKILLTKWTYKNYTESTLLPPLCVAAMKGHLEIVNFFCQLTPPPHLIQSAHGVTPLDLAKKNGHIDVVQRLSEKCLPKSMDRSSVSKQKHFTDRFNPYSKK